MQCLLPYRENHPLSCPIKGIIKLRSCKNQLAKNRETGRDKESPWAQVSPFVTLFSKREEAFQLECFLNTIT